jgi:hypothetical protein
MTPAQRADAELLRSLGRPAEAIAANSQIDLPTIKAWLKSGRWPESTPRQMQLFNAGASPRESTKPAVTTLGNSGLHPFERDAGGQDRRPTATHSGTERR